MITLRQLEIFQAVARREHVTEAAREVHLSQSAVSAALAELAERLGGPLFERVGRRLVLNDRGRRLTDDAADLLQRAADLVQHYTQSSTLKGNLRIGASSTIGTYLMPALIGTFVAAHPDVDINLEIGNSTEIEAQVLSQQLDLAFIEGPSHHPQIAATLWREDQLLVFVAKDHAHAKRRQRSLASLKHERWIMREAGSGTRSVLEAALRAHNLQVRTAMTFGSSEAVKQGVRSGLGLGCLSELAVQHEVASGELVALRIKELNLRRPLWRIARGSSYQSSLQLACIEHMEASPKSPRKRS
jgi:DNA-binding transcriptional LysR family regulator